MQQMQEGLSSSTAEGASDQLLQPAPAEPPLYLEDKPAGREPAQLPSTVASLDQKSGQQHTAPRSPSAAAASGAAAALAAAMQVPQQQQAGHNEASAADKDPEPDVVQEQEWDSDDALPVLWSHSYAVDRRVESVDDPSLDLVTFTEQQLSECQLQAGQEVRLQRKALRPNTSMLYYTGDESYCTEDKAGFTGEELLLRVERLRGIGATGEVYDVRVLQHVEKPDAAQAGLTPPAAAAAVLPGPLVGQLLSLKVSRDFEKVPEQLQRCMFDDDEDIYLRMMQASMAKHHKIMSDHGGPFGNIVCSLMFGSICDDGDAAHALLMDRASNISLDHRLRQLADAEQRGLSRKDAHGVMREVVNAVATMHSFQWAYLDLKRCWLQPEADRLGRQANNKVPCGGFGVSAALG